MKKLIFALLLTLTLLLSAGCTTLAVVTRPDPTLTPSPTGTPEPTEAPAPTEEPLDLLESLQRCTWVHYYSGDAGTEAYELTFSADGTVLVLMAYVQSSVVFYGTGVYTLSGDTLTFSAEQGGAALETVQQISMQDGALSLTHQGGQIFTSVQDSGETAVFVEKGSDADIYAHLLL